MTDFDVKNIKEKIEQIEQLNVAKFVRHIIFFFFLIDFIF